MKIQEVKEKLSRLLDEKQERYAEKEATFNRKMADFISNVSAKLDYFRDFFAIVEMYKEYCDGVVRIERSDLAAFLKDGAVSVEGPCGVSFLTVREMVLGKNTDGSIAITLYDYEDNAFFKAVLGCDTLALDMRSMPNGARRDPVKFFRELNKLFGILERNCVGLVDYIGEKTPTKQSNAFLKKMNVYLEGDAKI